MKTEMIALAALSAISLTPVFGADDKAPAAPAAAEPDPAAAEHATEAPKKKPKKLPEYTKWDDAAAAAEAWGLPIVVFVDVRGDKGANKFRSVYFNNKDIMKELGQHALYYHYSYPAKKQVARRGKPVDRNAPPEADFAAVKESERVPLSKLTTICNPPKNPAWGAPTTAPLPMLALADHTCKVYAQPVIMPEDVSVTKITTELQTMFQGAKYAFEIGPKTQKLMDKEAKEAARRAKRAGF